MSKGISIDKDIIYLKKRIPQMKPYLGITGRNHYFMNIYDNYYLLVYCAGRFRYKSIISHSSGTDFPLFLNLGGERKYEEMSLEKSIENALCKFIVRESGARFRIFSPLYIPSSVLQKVFELYHSVLNFNES